MQIKLETILGSVFGKTLIRAPRPLWRATAWVLGSLFFCIDHRGCRTGIVPLVRDALGTGTRQSVRIAWRVAVASTMYGFDSAEILFGNPATVAERARGRSEFANVDLLQRTLAEGRGVILAASFFSCFYYAMLARWPRADGAAAPRVHLVRPAVDPTFQALYEKILAFGGLDLSFIVLGDKRSALDAMSALRRGEIVICMMDHIDHDMAVVPGTFFGKPSCLAAGYLLLAERTGAPIQLCTTHYAGGRFVTTFGQPIRPADCPGDDRVTWMGERLNDDLERQVHRYPESWDAWQSVHVKWHFGREIAAAL